MGFYTEMFPVKHLKLDFQDGFKYEFGAYNKQQLEDSYTNDKVYIFCLLQTLWFILTIVWLMCDLLIGAVLSITGAIGLVTM